MGSNTVHLLVARPEGDVLHDLLDDLTMPRIGEAVGATGAIGPAKLREAAEAVRRLAGRARRAEVGVLLVGATEAVRRARDGDSALAAFSEAAEAPCRLISADAEARLSFLGATSTDREHRRRRVLVTDVGGGSTECILGADGRIAQLASVPIGSGAAVQRWLQHDPPTEEERRACVAGVREILAATPEGRPDSGLATGGTATSLPRLLGREEGRLDRGHLDECRRRLAAEPSATIASRYGVEPARARVLAGGVEILEEVMARYELDEITITHRGVRHGMILSYLERGDDWQLL